jgi:hypothetical protein
VRAYASPGYAAAAADHAAFAYTVTSTPNAVARAYADTAALGHADVYACADANADSDTSCGRGCERNSANALS